MAREILLLLMMLLLLLLLAIMKSCCCRGNSSSGRGNSMKYDLPQSKLSDNDGDDYTVVFLFFFHSRAHLEIFLLYTKLGASTKWLG